MFDMFVCPQGFLGVSDSVSLLVLVFESFQDLVSGWRFVLGLQCLYALCLLLLLLLKNILEYPRCGAMI